MLLIGLFLNYLIIKVEANQNGTSLFEVLDNISFFFQSGDYDKTFETFKTNFPVYGNDEDFQNKYVDFLVKIGKYDELNTLKTNKLIVSDTAREHINKSDEYIKKIRSRDLDQTLSLIQVSPRCFDLLTLAAELCLNNNRKSDALKYILMANDIKRDHERYFELFGRYKFMIRQYSQAIDLFKKSPKHIKVAITFETLYKEFNDMRSITFYKLGELLKSFNDLSLRIMREKLKDSFIPSIFLNLEIDVLIYAIELANNNGAKGALAMAKRLLNEIPNEKSYCMYLKCLINERENVKKIREEFNSAKTKVKLGPEVIEYFETKISQLENAENKENKKKNEAKNGYNKQRQEYKNYNSNRSGMNSFNAGDDFLGYYKTLEATKNTPEENLKKQYKKLIRNASRIKDKNERSEKMKKINKAWEILSSKKDRQMYDMGIDPENPQQFNNNTSYSDSYDFFGGREGSYATYNFGGQDMDDVFANFFGGPSRSRGPRGGRTFFRNNGRTYTFSTFEW